MSLTSAVESVAESNGDVKYSTPEIGLSASMRQSHLKLRKLALLGFLGDFSGLEPMLSGILYGSARNRESDTVVSRTVRLSSQNIEFNHSQ